MKGWELASKSYIDGFDHEGKSSSICKNCGMYMQKCLVMRMDRQEVQSEITLNFPSFFTIISLKLARRLIP